MGIVPHEVVVVAQEISDVSVGVHHSIIEQIMVGQLE
jgi:hypothetical protein